MTLDEMRAAEARLTLLIWMVGFNLVLTVGLFGLDWQILLRLPPK